MTEVDVPEYGRMDWFYGRFAMFLSIGTGLLVFDLAGIVVLSGGGGQATAAQLGGVVGGMVLLGGATTGYMKKRKRDDLESAVEDRLSGLVDRIEASQVRVPFVETVYDHAADEYDRRNYRAANELADVTERAHRIEPVIRRTLGTAESNDFDHFQSAAAAIQESVDTAADDPEAGIEELEDAMEATQKAAGRLVDDAKSDAGAAREAAERENYEAAKARWLAVHRKLAAARDMSQTPVLSDDRDALQAVADGTDEDPDGVTATLDLAALRAQLQFGDVVRQEAESHVDADEPYLGRQTFQKAEEHLDELLDTARERGFERLEADVSKALHECSAGEKRALGKLSDEDGVEGSGQGPYSSPADPTGAGAGAGAGAGSNATVDWTPTTDDGGDGELPDHEVVADLGSGGNADVHKVKLTDTGEVLALKVPRWQGTLSAEIVEQFRSEAGTWARIDDHENVIDVYDSGTTPHPWILLEYMEGGSLADWESGYSVGEAVEMLVDVCAAIRHAHRHGIVHTDLKPENILFTADGTPKVGDWGLAEVLLEHSTSIEGMTPGYAAPEQLDPEQFGGTDDYTDVYQLGVVAYETLTGQLPYQRSNPAGTMNAILNEDPAPPSEVANLPPQLDDVILTAMAREKSNRYESVLYFRDALQEVAVH